jgi:hypothetical protein
MTMAPPFVVNEAYARSCGLRDPSALWVRMAPGVWVIEQRLSHEEFLMIAEVAMLTFDDGRTVKGVKVADLYKPVYGGREIFEGVFDFLGAPLPVPSTLTQERIEAAQVSSDPVAWWLRIDLVPASERIRFPALPAKINMKEGLDLGDMRELYSWDGTGFKLRDEVWGRA